MNIKKIFITNIPSFYKINLYNEINKRQKIFVFFIGGSRELRNDDFFKGNRTFDYIILTNKSIVIKMITIYKIIRKFNYSELIVGGWDSIPAWITVCLFSKMKNAVVIESSYLESTTTGSKGLVKKCFMKRLNRAYVSGKAQKLLVEKLNFKGEIILTKGVGLFNKVSQPPFIAKKQVNFFIYVGRLSQEKNLPFLIKTFNDLPNLTLKIVGFGPMERELKQMAKSNIIFCGAVNNIDLSQYYQDSDVLVLPSLSEPWGLVVEEAFNNGLPVIVSDRVGCADEIIIPNGNGIIFSLSEKDSLLKAINKITDVDFYNTLRKNISQMDFNEIAEQQVVCYL